MAAQIASGFLATFKSEGEDGEDSYLQQYSRVVMVKVFLAAAVLCGIQGNYEDITCHLDSNSNYSEYSSVAQQACWSGGVYVYKEIRDSAYYGVPKDLKMDGIIPSNTQNITLCATRTASGELNPNCKKMNKVYFKQYQYIHYFLVVFAFLYWCPYWFFVFLESDVIYLRNKLKDLPDEPKVPAVGNLHDPKVATFSDFFKLPKPEDAVAITAAAKAAIEAEKAVADAKAAAEKATDANKAALDADVKRAEAAAANAGKDAAAGAAAFAAVARKAAEDAKTAAATATGDAKVKAEATAQDKEAAAVKAEADAAAAAALAKFAPKAMDPIAAAVKAEPTKWDVEVSLYLDRVMKIQKDIYNRQLDAIASDMMENIFSEGVKHNRKYNRTNRFHLIREIFFPFFPVGYTIFYIITFWLIDSVYYGHFWGLGINWAQFWIVNIFRDNPSHIAYPNLGDVFLPTVAFCDLRSIVGITEEILHETKLVCEVNKHSYLQYVFLLLWIFIVTGIVASILDFLIKIFTLVPIWNDSDKMVKEKITEAEYPKLKSEDGGDILSIRQRRYLSMIWDATNDDEDKLLITVLKKLELEEQKNIAAEARSARAAAEKANAAAKRAKAAAEAAAATVTKANEDVKVPRANVTAVSQASEDAGKAEKAAHAAAKRANEAAKAAERAETAEEAAEKRKEARAASEAAVAAKYQAVAKKVAADKAAKPPKVATSSQNSTGNNVDAHTQLLTSNDVESGPH